MFSFLRLEGQGKDDEAFFVPFLCLFLWMRDESPIPPFSFSFSFVGRSVEAIPPSLALAPSPLPRRHGVHHRKTGPSSVERAAAAQSVAFAV